MGRLELKARAKINLSLDVIGKRPDGYHDLRMIMQTVELHDRVLIEAIDEGIEVSCDNPGIPPGSGNIAYKAASLLMEEYKIEKGVRIHIEKRIPVAAGLAGGSSDAAAVMKGMNTLFSLGIKEEALMVYGKKVGADVPYCIKGGTILAEGIGEILTPLPQLEGLDVVLVKPKEGVDTGWVYRNLELDKIIDRPDTELLVRALEEKRIDILAKNMKNVLETVTAVRYGVINDIKRKLVELGALGSMMSGSGPAVFGIFVDAGVAERAFYALKEGEWECFLTKTVCEER